MKLIYSYNRGESVKLLKDSLGIRIIALKNSKFKGGKKKTVLNWGASELPNEVMKCNIINHPDAIKKAVDKRLAFKSFAEHKVDCLPFTEDKEVAKDWIMNGKQVVIRTKVGGQGGEGIVIAEVPKELVDAPLYTQYVPKTEEYRIHVFGDKVGFVQRKARDRSVHDNDVNWKVRNHANGFIFAHKDVDVPDVAKNLAIAAVKALGLDFGSVDMLWNKTRNKYLVIEVNTASGLAGETLNVYTKHLTELLDEKDV